MNFNPIEILESYVKGKDCDEYLILEKIYSANAEVVFKNAPSNISFPEKIHGNKEIARILSKDFNQTYRRVRTYYLSKPSNDHFRIEKQNWLVVMRDIETEKTRVGSGYYDWEFIDDNTLNKC